MWQASVCVDKRNLKIYLSRKAGVRIIQTAGDTVLLCDRFHLLDETHDRLVFLVRFAQSGFELFMRI